jgi:hypothetical protein
MYFVFLQSEKVRAATATAFPSQERMVQPQNGGPCAAITPEAAASCSERVHMLMQRQPWAFGGLSPLALCVSAIQNCDMARLWLYRRSNLLFPV